MNGSGNATAQDVSIAERTVKEWAVAQFGEAWTRENEYGGVTVAARIRDQIILGRGKGEGRWAHAAADLLRRMPGADETQCDRCGRNFPDGSRAIVIDDAKPGDDLCAGLACGFPRVSHGAPGWADAQAAGRMAPCPAFVEGGRKATIRALCVGCYI